MDVVEKDNLIVEASTQTSFRAPDQLMVDRSVSKRSNKKDELPIKKAMQKESNSKLIVGKDTIEQMIAFEKAQHERKLRELEKLAQLEK